ncbi:hypothetical protein IGI37_003324 [Enterococcus sp. AZ194]|uniref:DUF624 domain-containing protein n=1 Tax=Enterococcus sp. AZ194 TaxID=2774629 RepID=UPI003F2145D6
MRKLLNVDNPVVRKLGIFLDFFLLNIVVLFTSLPIVTIFGNGISLYYVMNRYDATLNQPIIRIYLKQVKQNFWTGIKLFFIFMPLGCLVLLSFSFSFSLTGFIALYSKVAALVGLLILNVLASSALFYFSRYEAGFGVSLKSSAVIASRSFSVILSGFLAMIVEIFLLHPSGLLTLLYIVTFGGICGVTYLNYKLLFPAFKKYE